MKKASGHGLVFRRDIDVDVGAHLTPIDDSFAEFAKGAYKAAHLGIPFYRPIDRTPEQRSTTEIHTINETIDASVFARWLADGSYRPQNLIDWANKHSVEPASLTTAVRADKPSETVSG